MQTGVKLPLLALSCFVTLMASTGLLCPTERDVGKLALKSFWEVETKVLVKFGAPAPIWSPSGRFLAAVCVHLNGPNKKSDLHILVCQPRERRIVHKFPAAQDWRNIQRRSIFDIQWEEDESGILWLNSAGEVLRGELKTLNVTKLGQLEEQVLDGELFTNRFRTAHLDPKTGSCYYFTLDKRTRALHLMVLEYKRAKQSKRIWPGENDTEKLYRDRADPRVEVHTLGQLGEPDQIFFLASQWIYPDDNGGHDTTKIFHWLYIINTKHPSRAQRQALPLPCESFDIKAAYWNPTQRALILAALHFPVDDIRDPTWKIRNTVQLWSYDVSNRQARQVLALSARYFELGPYRYDIKRNLHAVAVFQFPEVEEDSEYELTWFDQQFSKPVHRFLVPETLVVHETTLIDFAFDPSGRFLVIASPFELHFFEILDK
jgi:hypothetical protein